MVTSLNNANQGLNATSPPSGEISEEQLSQLEADIKSDLNPEIKNELKPEIKDELSIELSSELKPEIKDELKPELTAELKPVFFQPVIEFIKPLNFIRNVTHILEVRGSFFTQDLTVTSNNPNAILSPVQFVSSNLVRVPIFVASLEQNIILTFNNGIDAATETVASGFGLQSVNNTWMDLRDGSGLNFTIGTNTSSDLRIRSGMQVVRDGNGVYFTGREPLNSVGQFRGNVFRSIPDSPGTLWERGQNRKLSVIFGLSAGTYGMAIGGERSSINANNQTREWELGLFFAGVDELIELVGESNRTQRVNGGTLDDQITNYRLEITNDGGPTGVVTLHALPDNSVTSWEISNPVVIEPITNPSFLFRSNNLFLTVMPEPDSQNYVTAIRIV